MVVNPNNRSLEPLLNEGNDDGQGGLVTLVNDVGVASHRAEVSVTTTPTQITIGAGKQHMEVYNNGNSDVYYGGTGVDGDATGVPIMTGFTKIFKNVKSTFNFYVVTKTGVTSTLRIVEWT